jgi:hypothetical protein
MAKEQSFIKAENSHTERRKSHGRHKSKKRTRKRAEKRGTIGQKHTSVPMKKTGILSSFSSAKATPPQAN